MSALKALFRRGSSIRDDSNGRKDDLRVYTYNAAELKHHRPLTYDERELSEVSVHYLETLIFTKMLNSICATILT